MSSSSGVFNVAVSSIAAASRQPSGPVTAFLLGTAIFFLLSVLFNS